MDYSMPGFPVHHQLPELTQTHVHWVGDAIQPSHPLSSPSSPALIFLSIRVFSNESVLPIRWLKYWSFSFSISHSNEYSGLISFRMDWLDFLAVQGTLKSLLQHIERHRHRKHVWIPGVERGSGMNWEIKIHIYVHLCIKQTRSEVAQSCPTLCNPRDCNLPGSSVHGIFQARVLEWVVIFFSRGSSWPRGWTQVSYIAGRRFTVWAIIPQFKSINSLVLSFLYSPTLTSMHDYWKNHSFDKMDLCQQCNVSVF